MNGSGFTTLLFCTFVETFSIILSYIGQTIWTVIDGLPMF